MQNEEGQITELYIPRKWYAHYYNRCFFIIIDLKYLSLILFCCFSSATNRLITAKDHASVQINIGHLDESGVYNGHFSTFALCGFTRAQVSIFYFILVTFMISLDLED